MLAADAIEMTYATRAGELPVLRGVSLAMEPGESAAILGPSGSGKSTLLNILGTLEPPTSGRVRLDDTDPFSLSERALARFRARQVGFVFQDHHLLPQCSVLENVLVPTFAAGGGRGVAGHARALIERVGLGDRMTHRPGELSGGEKQRVALARALVNQPRLLLADEPTGNLDRTTARVIGDLLVELPREKNVILAVVTHSESLAERFGARFDLEDGRLIPR